MIETIIKDNEILAVEQGKIVGKIEFLLSGATISILHTYAYESGRGIGSLLMDTIWQWTLEHNYDIVPICSFAKKYIEKKEHH